MLEAICPNCGAGYGSWVLRDAQSNVCSLCGAPLNSDEHSDGFISAPYLDIGGTPPPKLPFTIHYSRRYGLFFPFVIDDID